MESVDLREELNSRITKIQQRIGELKADRDKIDQQLRDAESKLRVWREAYGIESGRLGEPSLPLFMRSGKLRFAGMKLTESLTIIRKEHPEITKKQAAQMLEVEGFDFRGKKPLRTVHFAWVALVRRGKQK